MPEELAPAHEVGYEPTMDRDLLTMFYGVLLTRPLGASLIVTKGTQQRA